MHVKGKNTLLPKSCIRKIELETRISSDVRSRARTWSYPVIHYQDANFEDRELKLDGNYSQLGRFPVRMEEGSGVTKTRSGPWTQEPYW